MLYNLSIFVITECKEYNMRLSTLHFFVTLRYIKIRCMKIAIGIDVGISTTKIVGIKDGKIVKPLRIKATDPVTSLYGAFGTHLYDNKI